MTIHGFWPSSTNLAYLSCLRKHKKDPYCTEEMPLMLELLSGEERSELEKYWPQLKNNKLWIHEWEKHGTCYVHLIKESGSPMPE
jgi:ribonuclease I